MAHIVTAILLLALEWMVDRRALVEAAWIKVSQYGCPAEDVFHLACGVSIVQCKVQSAKCKVKLLKDVRRALCRSDV